MQQVCSKLALRGSNMSKKISRFVQRAQNLARVEEFLLLAQAPIKQIEMAQKLNITPSTLSRTLAQLGAPKPEGRGVAIKRTDDGRLYIDKTRYLNNVKLNLDEAMVVFLAVRLLARYADKPNPHTVSALKQLSLALRKISPVIADHIALTSEKLVRQTNDEAKTYVRSFEALTRAWSSRTRVRIMKRDDPHHHSRLFEPYFIEPSMIGYLTYVIGYDHFHHEIRTYTIERLSSVTPTLDTYTIPESFDALKKLAGAWGVNWGDGSQTTEVALRFTSLRVAKRIRESNWHETQEIEDLPDGGCVLRIKVGSTLEMKPWIRQWGPDCEVLSPLDLRREIAEEMKCAGEIYK